VADALPRPETLEIGGYELEGLVVELARPRIGIEAVVEGRRVKVRIARLAPEHYSIALEAHREERPVRVLGTIRIGATVSFRRIESFALT
jgi:hypothetical protein